MSATIESSNGSDQGVDHDEEEPLDVLDLPQLYQKPTAQSLLSTLDSLSLQPASWDAKPRSTSERSTLVRRKRKVKSKGVPQYLTKLVSSSLKWIDDDEEKEKIWEAASHGLSERSGRTAMSAISRTFSIPLIAINAGDTLKPAMDACIEIMIHEPALTADNLGLKTWASSYLLAKRLCLLRKEYIALGEYGDILELGAGTGLVGLAAAAILQRHVVLTDLPEIVPNLERNIAANVTAISRCHDRSGFAYGSAEAAVLDWSKPATCTLKHLKKAVREAHFFELILAADPIYSHEHPALLVNAIGYHLRRDEHATVVIELPIREAYAKERQDLRDRMLALGLDVLEQGEEVGYDDWSDGCGEELTELKAQLRLQQRHAISTPVASNTPALGDVSTEPFDSLQKLKLALAEFEPFERLGNVLEANKSNRSVQADASASGPTESLDSSISNASSEDSDMELGGGPGMTDEADQHHAAYVQAMNEGRLEEYLEHLDGEADEQRNREPKRNQPTEHVDMQRPNPRGTNTAGIDEAGYSTYLTDLASSVPQEMYSTAYEKFPSERRRARQRTTARATGTSAPERGAQQPSNELLRYLKCVKEATADDLSDSDGDSIERPPSPEASTSESSLAQDGEPMVAPIEYNLPRVRSKMTTKLYAHEESNGLGAARIANHPKPNRAPGGLKTIQEEHSSAPHPRMRNSGPLGSLEPSFREHLRTAYQKFAPYSVLLGDCSSLTGTSNEHTGYENDGIGIISGNADVMPTIHIASHYQDNGEPLELESALQEAMETPLVDSVRSQQEGDVGVSRMRRSDDDVTRLMTFDEGDGDANAFLDQLDAAMVAPPTLRQLTRRRARRYTIIIKE